MKIWASTWYCLSFQYLAAEACGEFFMMQCILGGCFTQKPGWGGNPNCTKQHTQQKNSWNRVTTSWQSAASNPSCPIIRRHVNAKWDHKPCVDSEWGLKLYLLNGLLSHQRLAYPAETCNVSYDTHAHLQWESSILYQRVPGALQSLGTGTPPLTFTPHTPHSITSSKMPWSPNNAFLHLVGKHCPNKPSGEGLKCTLLFSITKAKRSKFVCFY